MVNKYNLNKFISEGNRQFLLSCREIKIFLFKTRKLLAIVFHLFLFKVVNFSRDQNSKRTEQPILSDPQQKHISHPLNCGSLFQPLYGLFCKVSVLLFLLGPDPVPLTPPQLIVLMLWLVRRSRRNTIPLPQKFHLASH